MALFLDLENIKWRNNESFEGPFEDGKINGVGTYKWADGFEYYGNYTNNTKEGDGIFKWPNGRTYKGPFKLGNPHGDGIMFEKKFRIFCQVLLWKINKI